MPGDREPFLTVYTPAYKRPAALKVCRHSVWRQTAPCQHVVVEDEVGLGVGGMYADVPNHHGKIAGDYVYFLSDDDMVTHADVAEGLERLVEQHSRPEVVVARFLIRQTIYPIPACWVAAPQLAGVTLGNWFVRRDVHGSVPYGHRHAGDFDFLAECWRRGLRFAWWDRIVGCAQDGPHHGRPE